MNKKITAINLADISETHEFEVSFPTHCPCCDSAVDARLLDAFYLETGVFYNSTLGNLYILFFCPGCEECFMATYSVTLHYSTSELVSLAPRKTYHKTQFSQRIISLSPNFVKIYRQSERAELDGLDEICGMGYRKALEFLVKDFAIHEHPDNTKEIIKLPLSQCTTDYIDSEKIQNLAKASAWLGNDETHYARKHEAYGISGFKTFLDATAAAIDFSLTCDDAASFLRTPK